MSPRVVTVAPGYRALAFRRGARDTALAMLALGCATAGRALWKGCRP